MFFTDISSGTRMDGTVLKDIKDQLKKGDTLVVITLDRLSRSQPLVLNLIKELNEKGITVNVLTPIPLINVSVNTLLGNILLAAVQ